jgi:uncharacterized membrane protein YfcA
MFDFSSLHFSSWGWVAVFAGAFCIGMNKGGLTGLGVVPVLIFAMVFKAKESTGFILPLLIVGDLCAIGIYHRVVKWRILLKLLPPTVAGILIGYFLMDRIAEEEFGPLIGWVIIALIVLQFVRSYFGAKVDHIFESHSFGVGMGMLAGVATMLANSAGPVSTLYFLSLRLPKWNLIGTSVWFFFVINLIKIPFSANLGLTNHTSVSLAVMLAPLVIVGAFGGYWLAKVMPDKIFERFLLICSAAGALKLIW